MNARQALARVRAELTTLPRCRAVNTTQRDAIVVDHALEIVDNVSAEIGEAATPPANPDRTAADQLRSAGWHVFAPGELKIRRIDHEGVRMRVIPSALHDVLCEWRVATPQGTEPEVLGCAGCGFCYPTRASSSATTSEGC